MVNSIMSSLQNSAKWSLGYGVFSRVAGRYASGMGNPYAVAASYFTSTVSEKCFNKISSYVGPVSRPYAVDVVMEVVNIAASTLVMQGVGQMIDPEFNCMTIAKINLLGVYWFTAAILAGGTAFAVASRLLASAPAKEEAPKPVRVKESPPELTELGVVGKIVLFATAATSLSVPFDILRSRANSTFWQEECYWVSKAGGHMMDGARIVCDYADQEKGTWLNSLQGDVFKFALYTAVFRIGMAAIARAVAQRKSESDNAKKETSQVATAS